MPSGDRDTLRECGAPDLLYLRSILPFFRASISEKGIAAILKESAPIKKRYPYVPTIFNYYYRVVLKK